MIGTFPKQIRNYNELEGTPQNLSDFVNDLPELIEVVNYSEIPLQDGIYLIENVNINIETNLINFLNNEIISLDNLLIVTNLTSKLICRRKLLTTNEDRGSLNQYYTDELFVNNVYIGTNTIRYLEGVYSLTGHSFKASDYIISILYSKQFKIVQLKSSGPHFKTVKLYYEYGNQNLKTIDGILVFTDIPFENDGFYQFNKAQISVDKQFLFNFEIGSYLYNGNYYMAIKDYSGFFKKSIHFNTISIILEETYQDKTLYANRFQNSLTNYKTNKRLNVVNLETQSLVHSNAMVLTFDEIYGGFLNSIYKMDSPNINGYLDKKTIENQSIIDDVDIIFSGDPQTMNIVTGVSIKESINVVPHNSNTLIRKDICYEGIDNLPPNYIAVTSRAETDNDGTDPLGTSYGFGVEFNEPTLSADLTGQGLTDWPGSQEHQQSPATAIVAGKLKKIKDETGAPWDIVREAARQTASNAGSYNIYRGFGVINVSAAIAAIPAMLDARSLELAEYFEATSKFPKELKYADKLDNTPVVKRDLENYDDFLRLSTPYTSTPQILKGNVIFQNNARFTFGNSFQMWSSGSEGRVTLLNHDLKINDASDNRFTFERTTGTFKANKFQLNDLNIAPASSTAPGTKGDIRITADYIYVCVAANTWKRTALSTW